MIINSFFTDSGAPKTGLSPTIRIWEVSAGAHSIIITDDNMIEVGDGFYKYSFTTYDATKTYVIRSDGGVGLADGERYEYAATEELNVADASVNNIAAGVWDEPIMSHINVGSTGESLALIKADTTSIAVSSAVLNNLVNTLLKYERNRTKIDTVNRQMIIYDDDCTTVLHVFDLKDSSGNPSISEVCERRPSSCP